MINKQGNPDNNIVHYGISPKEKEKGVLTKLGCFDNWGTKCGTGSYHINYTKSYRELTCKKCLDKIEQCIACGEWYDKGSNKFKNHCDSCYRDNNILI